MFTTQSTCTAKVFLLLNSNIESKNIDYCSKFEKYNITHHRFTLDVTRALFKKCETELLCPGPAAGGTAAVLIAADEGRFVRPVRKEELERSEQHGSWALWFCWGFRLASSSLILQPWMDSVLGHLHHLHWELTFEIPNIAASWPSCEDKGCFFGVFL